MQRNSTNEEEIAAAIMYMGSSVYQNRNDADHKRREKENATNKETKRNNAIIKRMSLTKASNATIAI